MNKDDLPDTIVTPRTIVSKATPADLERLAAWPSYPKQYQWANLTDGPPGAAQTRVPWWRQIDSPDRCHYSVVLPATQEIIGLHAFTAIDWANRAVGNMGIRMRPDYCDRRYCIEALGPLLATVLKAGMRRIRLDVAAPNPRAIRAYTRSGMRITGEFWREHTGGPIDRNDPIWPILEPHLKESDGKLMVRFYWMEIGDISGPCTVNPPPDEIG